MRFKKKCSNKLIVVFLIINSILIIFGGIFVFSVGRAISNSMYPIIKVEDRIFYNRFFCLDSIEIGDIIVFNAEGLWSFEPEGSVIHRVISKYYNETEGSWYFWTKGDNNCCLDESPIPQDRILGIAWLVLDPLAALIIDILYVFIIFLFFFYVFKFVRNLKKNRNKNRILNNFLL